MQRLALIMFSCADGPRSHLLMSWCNQVWSRDVEGHTGDWLPMQCDLSHDKKNAEYLLSSCILAMSCTSWTSLSLWLTEDSDMAEVVDSLSRSSTRMSWDDSRDNRFETSQLKQNWFSVGKPWLAGTDLAYCLWQLSSILYLSTLQI